MDCHDGLLCAKYSSVGTKIVPSSFATITLAVSRSFSIIFIHVNFCPPLGFFTYLLASLNAVFSGVLSGSLKRCPYQLSLLSFIVLLHSSIFILSYNCLFDILLGHLIFGQVNNADPADLAILVRDIKVHVVQFHPGDTE